MPGALTHTRITWALSPTAPQVPGVTPGSPLCPWCFGHSSWRGARQGVPYIAGLVDVYNMKIANPPDCSVTPAVVVHTPHPRTPSLQTDVATLIEDKSTLQTHAYSRVGVIKPDTYSRSLLRSAPRPKGQGLGCA